MSGICGIIHFDGTPVDADTLVCMARAAAHRCPDGLHSWVRNNVGMAQLLSHWSPEAHLCQTQVASAESVTIVADARIDNQDELQHLLMSGGYLHCEKPTTTDLMIGAYCKWGDQFPAHLIGDFAFALWDGSRRRLLAARDPMGMRTLYWKRDGKALYFATEVKQILALPEITPELNETAVGVYLAGPLMPPEWTLYKDIAQLAPAHSLVASADSQCVQRYWDINPDMRISYAREEEYDQHFQSVFEEAVRCRMRSKKPVGIFLSGGVDSSCIAVTAGFLQKQSNTQEIGNIQAYCWAFDELKSCDERHISDGIARHSQILVNNVPADDFWPLAGYPDFGPDQDDPFMWPYQALTEQSLIAAARDGTGIMMRGDRGDEMVGDWVYDSAGLALTGRWRELWKELRTIKESRKLPLLSVAKRYLVSQLRKQTGLEKAVTRMRRKPSPTAIPPWVHPQLARRIDWPYIFDGSIPKLGTNDVAKEMRYARIFMHQGYRLASLNERTIARYGMVYADPWSDRRIAEFVLATPQYMIQRASEPKRISRRMLAQLLPAALQGAPSKIIPDALFDRGFRERSSKTVKELIANSQAAERGYLDKAALDKVYTAYLNGERFGRFDFWWPLTFEMWLQRHWL